MRCGPCRLGVGFPGQALRAGGMVTTDDIGQFDPRGSRRWRLTSSGVLLVAQAPAQADPRDHSWGMVELWDAGRGSIRGPALPDSALMNRLDCLFPGARWYRHAPEPGA